ncbi:MAG: hypothetical protein ACM3XZ_09745 [Betaproteobacteria bacterium]
MLGRMSRTVKAVALVVLVAATGLTASLVVAMNSPGWRTMRAAFRTTYSSPAAYTQVVERRFGSQVRREEYRVWQDDHRRKVVQTAPASLDGTTLVWDNLSEVAFAPGFPYALHSTKPRKLPPVHPGPPWFSLRRLPHLKLGEEVLPGGVSARTVTAYAGQVAQVKLWIDHRTGFILRQERYNHRGEPFDVTLNRDIVLNPPGLEKALQVQIPAGAQRLTDPRQWRAELTVFALKKEAPFAFMVPQRLPPGYHLVRAEVLSASRRQLVALRFARRGRGFTLFEYPSGDPTAMGSSGAIGGLVAPGDRHGARVFRTVRSGIAVMAVGRLSPSDAELLFSSWRRIDPSQKPEPAAPLSAP